MTELKFAVAVVRLLDGRKFYCRNYTTLRTALNKIGLNRKETIEFVEMTEDEYNSIPATMWSAELVRKTAA